MQSFQLIKPCFALAPYIRHYWILQDDSIAPVSERILPIGCMQLVFHKGKQLLLLGESELQPQSFISGQSVGFSDVMSTGRIVMICFISQMLHLSHRQGVVIFRWAVMKFMNYSSPDGVVHLMKRVRMAQMYRYPCLPEREKRHLLQVVLDV